LDVDVLAADDWQTLRRVRLRALEESPDAYLSTYDLEVKWSESEWRRSFVEALWVRVVTEGRIVGLAHAIRVAGRPVDERHLECVWVDPDHRGAGVLRAVVEFLIKTEPDVREWRVWIIDGNSRARGSYEHLGFELTGERQLLPDESGRYERRLKLLPVP